MITANKTASFKKMVIKDSARRPRIAYFTINDPRDKRSWSGASYYMAQSIQKNVGDTELLGPVRIPWLLDKTFRAIQKVSRLLFRSEYIPKYSFLKNAYAAIVLKRKLTKQKFDFVFGPAAASELGCLNSSLPVVYFGDATFKIYSHAYKKEFNNVSRLSIWEGNRLEKLALKKSNVVIFSSQWAANSAINDYDISSDKIAVMHMGANIDSVPPAEGIYKKECNTILTLLFLSVDWERKGGSIAFETLTELYNQGISVKLIICGCIPPPEFLHPAMEVIPFLNKNNQQDFEQFTGILSTSHFLLLPTRADCTPLVNCEANAYGMPVVTTDVGGVSEAIKDGVNGFCLPVQADAKQYAKLISSIYFDKPRFHQLIGSSRKRFDEELNWDKFSENFKATLEKHKIYQF